MKYILSLAAATEQLARWQLPLFKFDLYVVHGAGFVHHAAGVLSCLAAAGETQAP